MSRMSRIMVMVIGCILISGCATLAKADAATVQQVEQARVTVEAIGQVLSEPDMASFEVTISKISPDASSALADVKVMSAAVMAELEKAGILPEQVRTTALSVQPEYEWSKGTYTLKGQRARQTIRIQVLNINTRTTVLSSLIDGMVKIDGLSISSISFDIFDKEALYSEARQKAYELASRKAQEYADLSGLQLSSPLSIVEAASIETASALMARSLTGISATTESASLSIPAGELKVTVSVSVTFSLDKIVVFE